MKPFSEIVLVLSRSWRAYPLAWEVSIVLALKLVLIIAIKIAFFSEPVDLKHQDHRVERVFGLETRGSKPSPQLYEESL